MQKGFVIILVLSIIIGIFAISNSGVVTIDFLFTQVLLSQAIVIFICVLVGALIATIFGWIRQMSLKKKIKELNKDNQALKDQVYELKVQVDSLDEKLKASEEELKLLNSKGNSSLVDNNEFIEKDEPINKFGVDDISKYEDLK